MQQKRIKALRKRRSRISQIRKAGINTARFFRSGFSAAVSWGMHAIGIAPSPLQAWRKEVAYGCAALASGKSIDLTLMFSDLAPGQKTDPAFQAHVLPIGYWAQAVWEGWRPRAALAAQFREALSALSTARHTWKAVIEPASACIASAMPIGWVVKSFCRFEDDLGQEYEFDCVSPAAVRNALVESLRPWQARRVAVTFPEQELLEGIRVKPLVQLLRKDDDGWGAAERGQLKSAIVGGR